ncbi:serine hydrolase domain-containing protein [Pseudoalteromonas piscicida]|uniref:serine hydrolase domain-containing protein n=1 Tax=Pseudoalteromonas piscicida TaxID=43662 RepID=UPI001C937A21|nr:serine hydrolase domain-containing protein [Pseudoalteromonas piscicida]QZO11620.1 beta-lactamase family protein [Pseudoalteromonas piscicida]
MKSLILTLVCFFCISYPKITIAKTPNQQWSQFLKSYSKQVERKLKEKSVPGAALSVVHVEHGSYAEGFGKTKSRQGSVVNEQTRFRLASVSKTFAGSLTAKLASEGYFNIDDRVGSYLPQVAKGDYSQLKLYHLLSHSSGLVPNAYDNLIESRMDYPQIVERLLQVKALCQPGECYGYQNVMFSLIGDVIEQATNISYKTWMEEFVFAPLNMYDAGLGYEQMTKNDNFAWPHVRGRKRWHTAKLKPHYYKVLPAAGVNASAADMAQWLKAQLGMYPSVLSPDALSKQSVPYTLTKRELRRRVWRGHVEEAYYGLGWRIYRYDGKLLYYHSGWVQGYRTDVVIIPELGIGFSLLLNAESGIINQLTNDFIVDALALEKKLMPQVSEQEIKKVKAEEASLLQEIATSSDENVADNKD